MGCIDFKELLVTQHAKSKVPEKEHNIYVKVWIPGRALTIKNVTREVVCMNHKSLRFHGYDFQKKKKHLEKIR